MQCFTVTHNGATNLKVLRMRRKSLVCLFTQHDTLLPLVKINFLSHFSSEALLLCALSQRLFGHILFLYSCIAPLVSRLQPQAQLKERRPYYAPGSTIPPQPSQPPLRNQQHCVTRQITSQRPPTPAQTLYVLALVVLQLPNPLSILFVRWKLGVKNGCVFQQSHGALSQSLLLSTLR